MNLIKPQSKRPYEYFRHVSQLIRTKETYIDNHFECSHPDIKKRISKKFCTECKEYKPILTQDEKNG